VHTLFTGQRERGREREGERKKNERKEEYVEYVQKNYFYF
jgi:hypothetical protein